MGYFSDHAANACIYTSYAVVLITGIVCSWWGRNKGQFLSGNGTRSAIPLTLNFVASGLGVGVLSTYPQIAAQSGLHGMFVYALTSALPFLLFGGLGPIIRRQMPEAFVLTEWVRYRYGTIASLVISCCTVLTIFLFMVSELGSLKACVETLTGVPGLPVLIVEAVLVSIYTAVGGFYVSFLTDTFQVLCFLILLVICIIGVGCTVHVDKELVKSSDLLLQNKLGWKLIYILTVAVLTNDCFMSGFWMRTFAAKTDRDLYISAGLTTVLIFCLLSILAVPGLLAVWSGVLDQNADDFDVNSPDAFYLLIASLPSWLTGFVLVFSVFISSCTFDSLQSAIVSTISNDFFRNRVRDIWVRLFVLATMAPCIVVAVITPNVLNIYLIVDVLSAAVVPVLFLGLSRKFWFLTGFEIITSIVGGIIGVFIYGTIYYHSAKEGGALLIMEQGLYGDDWGPFGAFVAAPVCCVIGAIVGLMCRLVYYAITERRLFAVFDKPVNGEKFFPPIDNCLFRLPKPWYEYAPLGGLSRKVDYWLFVQDGDDNFADNFKLPKPWYEYLGMHESGPKIDRFIFRPEEVFTSEKLWYERMHLGYLGKGIDYLFNGSRDDEKNVDDDIDGGANLTGTSTNSIYSDNSGDLKTPRHVSKPL